MISFVRFFRELICSSILMVFISFPLYSQVGINTVTPMSTFEIKQNVYTGTIDMNTPVPGFLAPRMRTSELVSFLNSGGQYTSAHAGTMIYIESADVDVATFGLDSRLVNINNPGFYFYDGTTFIMYASSQHFDLISQPWYDTLTDMGATSNIDNIYQNAQVGIGKRGIIDANAQLEISATDKGLIIPRLSINQRDAIAAPTVSMMIWNTDELCFNFYKGAALGWKSICENSTAAEFTISNCSSSSINGTYVVGTPVDNANYIQLSVNVTKTGSYNIEATTNIGLYFQKNGTFPSTGNYTIVVPAFGNPTTATADIIAPLSDEADLSVNGEPIQCKIKIPVINPAIVTYSFVSATAQPITKGVATNGNTVTLTIDVTVAGTSDISATDTQGVGISYRAYNQVLNVGTQTVTLYSDGVIIPSSFSANTLAFNLEGLGQVGPGAFTIPIASSEAQATCTNISVNGVYVAGKPLASGNTILVSVNVTSTGSYTFSATNAASNIQYYASGGFTTTGPQVFTATASLISNSTISNNVDTYQFTSSFNGNTFCDFNLDVIYPSTNILFYTANASQLRLAMTPSANTNNFSPTGVFKTEATNNIYDGSSWTLSSATLLNYINNQNVQIIVIPSNVSIPDDAQQVLANFINKRKGLVIFTAVGETSQAGIIKTLIQKTYSVNSATVTVNNFGSQYLQAYALQGDNTNPYLNGPFGNLLNKFYLLYNYNRTPDIVLPNGSTVLKSLVKLPNAPALSARDALVYSETPGLFILPGDNATLGNPNTLYGNYSPIQPNTQPLNVYAYSGTAATSNVYPTQVLTPGLIINWVLYGNIMAEYIKYSYYNYDKNIVINALP